MRFAEFSQKKRNTEMFNKKYRFLNPAGPNFLYFFRDSYLRRFFINNFILFYFFRAALRFFINNFKNKLWKKNSSAFLPEKVVLLSQAQEWGGPPHSSKGATGVTPPLPRAPGLALPRSIWDSCRWACEGPCWENQNTGRKPSFPGLLTERTPTRYFPSFLPEVLSSRWHKGKTWKQG